MMHGEESSLSKDSHQTSSCDYRDPLDENHLSKLDDSTSTLGNFEEKEEIYESTSNANKEKMNAGDNQNEDNVQDGVPPLLGPGYSFPDQFEGSNLDRVNSVTKTLWGVASSSVSQKEFLLWVNEYKCSICGIEMPPSFVEERQDHFDFHLAEKLQKEESGTDFITCVLKKRNVPKDHIASQRKHKKQKPSPKEGKHIPIDVFFVKSNQNF